MTYTYAVLHVSPFVYDEIRGLLKARGYSHAFRRDSDGEVIDMHGIALQREEAPSPRPPPPPADFQNPGEVIKEGGKAPPRIHGIDWASGRDRSEDPSRGD